MLRRRHDPKYCYGFAMGQASAYCIAVPFALCAEPDVARAFICVFLAVTTAASFIWLAVVEFKEEEWPPTTPPPEKQQEKALH